jgi:hypothetical protein
MREDQLGLPLPAALRDIDTASQDHENARRDLAGGGHSLPAI